MNLLAAFTLTFCITFMQMFKVEIKVPKDAGESDSSVAEEKFSSISGLKLSISMP